MKRIEWRTGGTYLKIKLEINYAKYKTCKKKVQISPIVKEVRFEQRKKIK